ncbi:MAG: nitroreductase family protein [Pseudomonadota bacterium]
MDLPEVMRTTFAAREFTDAPVSNETIYKILDNARFGPSGGNRQGWKVIVIRDQTTREALVEHIGPCIKRYIAQTMAGESPWNTIHPTKLSPETIENTKVPSMFIDTVMKAPVLLLVCVDLSLVASFDSELERVGVISGASIYPFVWNILLGARNEGLGGTLTTFVAHQEPKVQQLLGLPDHFAVSALLPVGQPVKQLTKLKRKSVEEFAVLEKWDGETLTQSS